MFLLGIIFTMRLQPIFIVRILILITLLYSYMIYRTIGSFWFRYILLIVILRGVLVVFTYIVVLIPNESFEVYNLIILFSFIVLVIVEFIDNYILDYGIIRINVWVTYLGIITLFITGFLLIVILLVVSLSYINDGALRIK